MINNSHMDPILQLIATDDIKKFIRYDELTHEKPIYIDAIIKHRPPLLLEWAISNMHPVRMIEGVIKSGDIELFDRIFKQHRKWFNWEVKLDELQQVLVFLVESLNSRMLEKILKLFPEVYKKIDLWNILYDSDVRLCYEYGRRWCFNLYNYDYVSPHSAVYKIIKVLIYHKIYYKKRHPFYIDPAVLTAYVAFDVQILPLPLEAKITLLYTAAVNYSLNPTRQIANMVLRR